MTCAEKPSRRCERAEAHAKKEKQGCDVCGKSQVAVVRGRRHTPKRKSKVLTCAEKPSRRCKRALAHAKKKKQGCDVCGAAILPAQEGGGTRQK